MVPAEKSSSLTPEEKALELSKAVAKNREIGSKESLDVALKCQDEVLKILRTLPEDKRTELTNKCKEARAQGRKEIQEEIKKNGSPKTPWYSPIVNFGETLVDVGIAVVGTAATLPKLPSVVIAEAKGAASALKDGKGVFSQKRPKPCSYGAWSRSASCPTSGSISMHRHSNGHERSRWCI